jgi:hypothetical protein
MFEEVYEYDENIQNYLKSNVAKASGMGFSGTGTGPNYIYNIREATLHFTDDVHDDPTTGFIPFTNVVFKGNNTAITPNNLYVCMYAYIDLIL